MWTRTVNSQIYSCMFFLFNNTLSSHLWPRKKAVYGPLTFAWLKLDWVCKESSRQERKRRQSRGEGGEHRREISPGTAELEETETEEEERREGTLPNFSQARGSANRAWEERKDQVFSVEHFVHGPSIGMFKKIYVYLKKKIQLELTVAKKSRHAAE